MSPCPICGETLRSQTAPGAPHQQYGCPRCGEFWFGFPNPLLRFELTPHRRSVLSHRLRRMQAKGEIAIIQDRVTLDSLRVDDPLPSPAEQLDNLILWTGNHQPNFAEPVEVPVPEVSAWIGAPVIPNNPTAGISWLLNQEQAALVFERRDANGQLRLRLKLPGWQRYESLKHAVTESHNAFMAMQFGDRELNDVVDNCFRSAVRRAGFELKVLTDGQPAGLIDDQLRVALRTSRFVVADLTHGNRGSYWEAGFAEGLGRPVIYTCRRQEWEERDEHGKAKVHFDTHHLVTIIWEPDKLRDAGERLTATIRATLPEEARMTDESP